MLASRCGYSADYSGPVNDRAVLHIDNCYHLPNLHVVSHRCKTNTQSSTAFRGFGGPQGMFGIETVIEAIANTLGKDPLDVRRLNLYRDPAVPAATREVHDHALRPGDRGLRRRQGDPGRGGSRAPGYAERRAEVDAFNAAAARASAAWRSRR
jgi:xanthine dehydrogenase large subunit